MPIFEFVIPNTFKRRIECEQHYRTLWEMFAVDVLPLTLAHPWSVIAVSFRLEDGHEGIVFESSDGCHQSRLPGVRVYNAFMKDEVDQLSLREDIGQVSDEEATEWWNQARADYAEMLLKSFKRVDNEGKMTAEHKPFSLRIYCYDDVVCTERFE